MLTHLVMFKMSVVKSVCLCHKQQASALYSLCMSQTVWDCHRQFLSVTDSRCLSHKIFVCQRKYVSVTKDMCLSQTVCVCPTQSVLSQTVCVCHRQSVSLSNTLLDHSWPDFYIYIHDFHQNLSVRFQFVRDFNPIGTNFVDPLWLPYYSRLSCGTILFG